MSEKINLPDLIDLLSEKAGLTKKEAETFLKECFSCMDEGLLQDQVLKLKNIGTFKIILVKARESINVTTGERVVISPHSKISFTPDKNLAETINEPFALFQPEEVNDNAIIDEDPEIPEEEIQEEAATEDVTETEPTKEETAVEAETEPETTEIETPEEIVIAEKEETITEKTENSPNEKDIHPPKKNTKKTEKNLSNSQIYWDFYFEEEASSRKKRRKKKFSINWKILLTLFFIVLLGAFIIYIDKKERTFNYFKPGIQENQPPTLPKDSLELETDSVMADTTEIKVDTIEVKINTTEVKTEPDQTVKDKDERKTRVIQPGERLTTIALEEYGDKIFWVYIYMENKDLIPNPNTVKSGVKVVIPAPSKYEIDKNNPESIRKAEEIRNTF